ncbi:MAG: hypothetical protein AAGF28_10485 [Pseudomonadota bacterium]
MRKHLPSDEIDPITGKSKKQRAIEAAIQRTLDWLLANDVAYRKAHENVLGAIRTAQSATQTSLERVLEALTFERSVMDEILASAAKLPDGTRVFKDRGGNVRNEDGEIIPAALAATVRWSGDEPSYEQYETQRKRIEGLEATEQEAASKLNLETSIPATHATKTRSISRTRIGMRIVLRTWKIVRELEASLAGQHEQNLTVDHAANQASSDLEEVSNTAIPKFGNKP